MFNPTTQIVANYVIPLYLKRGDRYVLYMDVGQEVTDMARKIISCETEYESEDGEMFPKWASLTCCPRTYNMIQWGKIAKEINRIADAKEAAKAEEVAKEATKAKEAEKTNACIVSALLVGVALVIDPFAAVAGIFFASFLRDSHLSEAAPSIKNEVGSH